MLIFSSLVLWTLKVNRCYCFLCVRVSLFVIFCILQAIAATRFRCDEKYNKNLAANLLLSPIVT